MALHRSVACTLLVSALAISGCGIRSVRARSAGVELELRAKAGTLPSDRAKREKALEAVQEVLFKRVTGMRDVVEPEVRIDGERLVVDLPGIRDGRKAADELIRSGSLDLCYMKNVETADRPGKWKMEHPVTEDDGFVFTGPGGREIDSKKNPEAVLLKVVDAYEPVKNPSGQKPVLTGADLVPNATADLDQQEGAVVRIEFNPRGTKIFHEFTRSHIGEILGIFYDGKLVTAPVIKAAIPVGKAQISGFKSVLEAQDVAETLNGGPLPVPLEVVGITTLPGRAAP